MSWLDKVMSYLAALFGWVASAISNVSKFTWNKS